MKCKQAINPTTTAEGTCVNMFMDLYEGLSDIYLEKAEKATTEEEKNYYYNKVLYYSGLRAVLKDRHISPLRLTMNPALIGRSEDDK
ncbi:MAG: hypothetical protein DKM50_10690 [Candidatus Margulisiibacteriota bacterium]|nr:MAG: hypothetical protein A2X42_12920 [Candidatus Margulisbacteria bacterium GWF2_38_17]OGI11540.1 MAG: hypothetical protein A2X41_00265 [Candidatus Margulisbacteria bacterium GWE2_39_32]PZM78781.1 MAG: hypothetical protein DKM50_10690 [Candidatus Margulisiibacteriota bacterium]HCT84172.1 hypothetical protein [Candidatus Margulisiibacteriota bacterium]HCY36632.1 hypothetical protein [Candidatus Margulisiibacteriota bacterium]